MVSLSLLVQQASALNIKIIEVSWLLDSFDASKLADENKYILKPASSTAKDKNGKKRARSETSSEDEASISKDDKEKPPAKKQKDEPKDEPVTPSKPLHIPVDTECPLAGWSSDHVAIYIFCTLIGARHSYCVHR